MRRLIFTLTLAIIGITGISAQEISVLPAGAFLSRYNIEELSMSDGLPHNYVSCAQKDDVGYLWLATLGGGLCRYDGYDYQMYETKSNFINGISIDKFNRLWAATMAGIDVINIENNLNISEDFSEIFDSTAFNSDVNLVSADDKGNVWMVQGKRLMCVTVDGNGTPIESLDTYSYGDFTALYKNYVASGDKLYKTKVVDNQIVTEALGLNFTLAAGAIEVDEIAISCIFSDNNIIWIGTDGGLYSFNLDSNQTYYYDELGSDKISAISTISKDILAITTNNGLKTYNRADGETESVNEGFSCNQMTCVYGDGQNIYIGTESGGLNIVSEKRVTIRNYSHSADYSSISSGAVNAIIEDKEGNLFTGNVASGINLKKKDSEEFIHFTAQNHGLPSNDISCFTIDSDNHLWAGTWGAGIVVLDLNKENFPVIEKYNNLTSPYIGSVTYDRMNNLVWVGTSREIAAIECRSDLDYNKRLIYPVDSDLTKYIQGSLGSLIDMNGNLWMGTSDDIIVINLRTFRNGKVEAKRSETGIQYITSICQTKDGTIYTGNNGFGVFVAKGDEKTGHIRVKDGLINDCVKGVLDDLNGNIWITTDGGLSMYIPSTGNSVNYTKKNGLRSESFYWNATYRSPETEKLYFGTLDGLTEVSLVNVTSEQQELQSPTFTSFSVETNDDNYVLERDIARTYRVSVEESDRYISIGFSAMNFSDNVHYQYRLKGFDKEDQWLDVKGYDHTAVYSTLPAGEYIFQVRYIDGYGNYSPTNELLIEVQPYFYRTLWFYCLVIAFIVVLLYYVLNFRVKRYIGKCEHLQKVVDMRTAEIRELEEEVAKVRK